MTKSMVLGYIYGLMVDAMKVNGVMENRMAEESIYNQMELSG